MKQEISNGYEIEEYFHDAWGESTSVETIDV
jgi:hypothetical protein